MIKISKLILVLGPEGSGKSSSTMNLDPKETFIVQPNNKIVDLDDVQPYDKLTKKGNVMEMSNIKLLPTIIKNISDNFKHVKTLIIDDFSYYQSISFLNGLTEKKTGNGAFEKYNVLAAEVHQVMLAIRAGRDDMVIVLMSHTDTDDTGREVVKSVGKLTQGTIAIGGLVNYSLKSTIKNKVHVFKTKSESELESCRVPRRSKLALYIPNDLRLVLDEFNKMNKHPVSKYVSEEMKSVSVVADGE